MLKGEDCYLNQFFSWMYCLYAHSKSWAFWRIPGMLCQYEVSPSFLYVCVQLSNRMFVLLLLQRQWIKFSVFVDMFPCKTKMLIWGTSQRMVPAVTVQLTDLHLLHAPLLFPFGVFSTVGAPSWIDTSYLVDLFCCLAYERRFSQ